MNTKIASLDTIRGLAVFLMIIFHFFFDLDYFHFISIDIQNDIFWNAFRVLIVSMFLFSLGYSLILSTKKFDIKKVSKKLGILFVMASSISIVTYFIFPYSWIYFGILHLIFTSYFVGLFFRNISGISLIILASILHTLYLFDILNTSFIYDNLQVSLSLPYKTKDIARFFPWFSMVLLGMAASKYTILEKISLKKNPQIVNIFSKNALIIYMIHQPILFSLVYLATLLN